ncbi:MAG: type I-C CRISPR-associated protein Cas8c/Csd1 [Rikenellaceae bacterium]
MILKALYDYYHRSGTLAPQGMEYKEIAFLIVINREGKFIRIEDRRNDKKISCKFLVVKGIRSGSSPKPYIFWDNVEYMLNYTNSHAALSDSTQTSDKTEKDQEVISKAQQKHDALKAKYKLIAEHYPNNYQFRAVTLFFDQAELVNVYQDPLWIAIANKPTVNISFLIEGELSIVAEHEDLRTLELDVDEDNKKTASRDSICLITGNKSIVAESTTPTGIPGGQATARLVAFQVNSGYDSYGKSKGFNASISKEAEACYTTALNKLLAKDSRNKFFIGSRTFLFWASSSSQVAMDVEDSIFTLFGLKTESDDNPNRGVEQAEKLFKAIYSGALRCLSDDKFYFLGLAPNSARIAVTYWIEAPIKEFANLILKHFDDFEIADTRKEKRPYKGLYQILSAVTLNGKASDCQPNLPENIIKSILQGTPYSYALFSATMSRIRAEQTMTITRAAIIKAYLNRLINNNKKITVKMDKENTNQGYLCGRLFATLEYVQERSGVNTIRSKFMNAASATPATVFANLLNLSVYHSEKLDKGSQIFFENIKTEIIAAISPDGFPAHLDLQDQGRFMVGYYHQRSIFYSKSESKKEDSNSEE